MHLAEATSNRLAWHRATAGWASRQACRSTPTSAATLGQLEVAWTPPVDADDQPLDGTEACELTDWVDQHIDASDLLVRGA
jgi:hypothetical protein